jgi:signal transduction histidine kinase
MAAEECARAGAELDAAQQDGQSTLLVDGVTKLLRRAIRNLLENARRHAAGSITVTLGRNNGQAMIRVCDRGPGVPEDLRERIFEPFYRLPGATERDGGVGLGLSLVKSITIRHGGTVVCENRPDGGACFVIHLPLAPAAKHH